MVLGIFTVLIMGIVAYAYWREGPLTAFAMCVNVVIAGLLAFNFWEPIADHLDPVFAGTFAEGIEDALAIMLIFLPVLMLLRLITNTIANTHMEYPPILYRGGAVLFALMTGYLVSGFLVCVLQTLPVQQSFLTFELDEGGKAGPLRRVMPPDMVWLAMLHKVTEEKRLGGEQFDRNCSFELRYYRYRRTDDNGKSLPYRGELEP
jgi:hypothetical protein